jgi:hypothetical protein
MLDAMNAPKYPSAGTFVWSVLFFNFSHACFRGVSYIRRPSLPPLLFQRFALFQNLTIFGEAPVSQSVRTAQGFGGCKCPYHFIYCLYRSERSEGRRDADERAKDADNKRTNTPLYIYKGDRPSDEQTLTNEHTTIYKVDDWLDSRRSNRNSSEPRRTDVRFSKPG